MGTATSIERTQRPAMAESRTVSGLRTGLWSCWVFWRVAVPWHKALRGSVVQGPKPVSTGMRNCSAIRRRAGGELARWYSGLASSSPASSSSCGRDLLVLLLREFVGLFAGLADCVPQEGGVGIWRAVSAGQRGCARCLACRVARNRGSASSVSGVLAGHLILFLLAGTARFIQVVAIPERFPGQVFPFLVPRAAFPEVDHAVRHERQADLAERAWLRLASSTVIWLPALRPRPVRGRTAPRAGTSRRRRAGPPAPGTPARPRRSPVALPGRTPAPGCRAR